MKMSLASTLIVSIFISMIFSTTAQTCKTYVFSNDKVYDSCTDLPVLSSFLYWNFYPSNRTVSLAFRHTNTTSSTWIAWAINPNATGMIGSQALVAFQNDTGLLNVYTSPVSYGTSLQPGNLSFPVLTLSGEYSYSEMIIFATLILPEGNSTSTTVNQVWQNGPVSGNTPLAHPTTADHLKSTGTIDFLTG